MGSLQPTIYVFGAPSAVGGAGTELWHTLRLWRQMELPVTCIPTWQISPYWYDRLRGIGCPCIDLTPAEVTSFRALRGGIAVAFCNRSFLQLAPELRRLSIPLIWAGCMNWLFPAEIDFYQHFGPMDAYVFQSRYQLRTLLPQLAPWGVSRGQTHHIRGAFFADEFPYRFRPRRPEEPLILGRLCRASPEKFPRNFWKLVESIDRPVHLRVMGWSPRLEQILGTPPPWAEVLPPGAIPVPDFLASVHVLIAVSGTAVENWPRIGLEAMACGVPVVAPASGGWPEMIHPDRNGLLFRSQEEFRLQIRRLYDDDSLRLYLAEAARDHLLTTLANPAPLLSSWQKLFHAVASSSLRGRPPLRRLSPNSSLKE